MNYMKEVAHILGLELNEKFRFKSTIGLFPYDLRFTKKKLEMYDPEWKIWNSTSFETLCNLFNGKYEVVKLPKPILDDVEKKYLSRVIRPWRDKVEYIRKINFDDEDEFIVIIYRERESKAMPLPCFKKGTMYKGMELQKEYSLEDLGL